MGAIDVGVGHDDDTFVPQAVGVAILAHSAAEREREVGAFLIGAILVGAGAGEVQLLAADRQAPLSHEVARLLGASAGAVALVAKYFRAFGALVLTNRALSR